MKFQDSEKEIKEREYLIGMQLQHESGAHKIRIDSLESCEIKGKGIYYVRCHYYKENEKGIYGNILLANKLNDILNHFLPISFIQFYPFPSLVWQ